VYGKGEAGKRMAEVPAEILKKPALNFNPYTKYGQTEVSNNNRFALS